MRKLAIPFLCLAVVTAACSGPAGEQVATVNGTVITVEDVSEMFASETIPIDTNFRMAAFRLVVFDVLESGYEEDFSAELDDAAVEALFQEFMADIEAQGLTIPQAFGIPDATENMVEFDAKLTIIRDEVVAALASDPGLVAELQALLAASPASLTTVCARHILSPTEDAALLVIDRLARGDAFADVATEVSLDSAPGGDLGCASPTGYVPEFADATMTAVIGEVHGPVATDFGFHVLIVDERITPTSDELAADPAAFTPVEQKQALWGDWFNGHLGSAEIDVNPKFGVWDPATLRIVAPPEG